MLKNMDYVYAVHVNKSFSKAAEELYISQPALSATIKRVEAEIGLPIFNRSTNPIQLTPAGEYYIESIIKIMNQEKEMRAHFNSLLETNRGMINVGAASFFCSYILPTIIQEFQAKYPDYTINLLEGNADDLIRALRLDKVDIIIDVEKKGVPKGFDSFVWEKEHILLAVPASYEVNNHLDKYRLTFDDVANGDHMNERHPKVNLKDFKNENFLLLKEGNDMNERSLRMFQNAQLTPNVSMYLDQMLTSYNIACYGKGIAFVRAGVTQHLEPTNKLFFYKINDENAYQNIILYYKKSDPLTEVGINFIKFLQSKKHVEV